MDASPARHPSGAATALPSAARGALGADAAFLLLLALGALSALKGLNLIVTPTSTYFYYTDYRFGFVLRGLVGQLFAPILDALPLDRHDELLIGWHYAMVAVLLVALARLAAGTVAAAGRRADVLAMAALLVCSPLVQSLAYFTASPDILLCLLTLGVAAAVRARRLWLAWTLFVVGALAHQLMIFVALPVMVLASLVHAERPLTAVAGSLAVGLAACLLVLAAPAPDERLLARLVEQGIAPDEASDLYEMQLGQTFVEMLGVMAGLWRKDPGNGAIAVAYGASSAAVILGAALLSPGAVRPVAARLAFLPEGVPRTALAGLLAVGAGLSPLLVLAFAWDLSRLAVLSILTAFLVADMLVRRDPPPAAQGRPLRSGVGALACGVLAACFLYLPFIGLWFTGSHLNERGPLVRNPVMAIGGTRAAVEGFLKRYDRRGL